MQSAREIRRVLPVLAVVFSVCCATTGAKEADRQTIELGREVVFRSPVGAAVKAVPGKYSVSKAGPDALRLVNRESGVELDLRAITSKHEESTASPLALSIPGDQGRHDVVLLLPAREQLDAVGYVGGVAPRGRRATPIGRKRIRQTAQKKIDSQRPASARTRPSVGEVMAQKFGNLLPEMGAVGIGTRDPQAKLDVRGKELRLTHKTDPHLTLSASGDGGGSFGVLSRAQTSGSRQAKFVIRSETANRDHLTISQGGKVVIGPNTSEPSSRNFKPAALDVRTSANPSPGMGLQFVARFANSGGSGSGVIIQSGYEHQSAKAIECLRLASFDGPAKFVFFNDGRSHGLSDARLKENVRPLDGVLDRLADVRGVTFDWKQGSRDQLGLIAQEVEAAFPQLVSETDGHKGVDYVRFTAVLLEAVKELEQRTQRLQEDNESLRRRLEALER